MKTNYKPTDKIIVTKPGMFEYLPGTVISNNTDTKFKPLSVLLDNGLGVWQYSYAEIKPLKCDVGGIIISDGYIDTTKPIKAQQHNTVTPKQAIEVMSELRKINSANTSVISIGKPTENSIDNLTYIAPLPFEVTAKRKYQKRDKSAPVKEKRPYNKKQK